MADKKDDKDNKIMDVSDPGSTKPSENSRNIIIKSKPILKDPMISNNQGSNIESETISEEEPTGPPEVPKTLSRKINIEPLRDNIKEDQDNKEDPKPLLPPSEKEKSSLNIVSPTESTETNVEEKKEPENELKLPIEEKPKEEETKDSKVELSGPIEEKPKEEDSISVPNETNNLPETNTLKEAEDKPEIDPSKNETNPLNSENNEPSNPLINKKQVNESSEEKLAQLKVQEEQKRQEAINRMVESKQYFLPINQNQKRKTKHFVIIGILLSIILLVVWLYVASNAGIIKL